MFTLCVQQGAQLQSPEKQHWYGSEEFLALPAQLHKTELLALKLESLAQSLPLVNQNRSPHARWGVLLTRLVHPVCRAGGTLPRRLCRMWTTGI